MRLKEIMMEKHITGTALAQQLGVSPAYVNMVIKGKTNISLKKCDEIARILNVPVAALFDGYTEPGTCFCPHCGKPVILSKS